MSEDKKFSSLFSCETDDESFDKKDAKHGTEVINLKVKRRKMGTKTRSLRLLETDLDNLSQLSSDSNQLFSRIRGADQQFRRNQLVRSTGGAVIAENNANGIGRFKQSSRFKSCFSSNEIKADNVDNCSVLSENTSVVLL